MVKNNYELCFSSHAMICSFFWLFLCIFNCLLLYKISHTVENYKRRNSNRSLLQYLMQLVAFYSTFYCTYNVLQGKISYNIKMSAKKFSYHKNIHNHVFNTPNIEIMKSLLMYEEKIQIQFKKFYFLPRIAHKSKVKIVFSIHFQYIILNNYNT